MTHKLLSKDGKSVCAVSEDQQGYDSVSIQVRKLFEAKFATHNGLLCNAEAVEF